MNSKEVSTRMPLIATYIFSSLGFYKKASIIYTTITAILLKIGLILIEFEKLHFELYPLLFLFTGAFCSAACISFFYWLEVNRFRKELFRSVYGKFDE